MIQRSVQDPLAELILGGQVRDGDTVKIAAGKKGLTFNGKALEGFDDGAFEARSSTAKSVRHDDGSHTTH